MGITYEDFGFLIKNRFIGCGISPSLGFLTTVYIRWRKQLHHMNFLSLSQILHKLFQNHFRDVQTSLRSSFSPGMIVVNVSSTLKNPLFFTMRSFFNMACGPKRQFLHQQNLYMRPQKSKKVWKIQNFVRILSSNL